MDINTKINLMQINNIPVPRQMLEQGVSEMMKEISQIIRELPQERKDEIDAACEKHDREFRERYKDLLNNLSPIPTVKMKTLVEVLLQDSRKFENMSDQEAFAIIDGDFCDLFFELEEAVGLFKDRNLELSRGTMSFVVKSIGASVRESTTKIHQSLEELYSLLPCKTEEDIRNVFRQHTILFSYMQNLIL